MKRLLSILLFVPILCLSQYTSITDQNFEQSLIVLGHDDIIDGQVLTAKISGVDSLIVNNRNISDLTGIESFSGLLYLDCMDNQLTSLDISQNTALTYLSCWGNQLTSLDLSQNTALTELYCSYNQITILDVSANTALTKLHCIQNFPYGNPNSNLDLTSNTGVLRFMKYE